MPERRERPAPMWRRAAALGLDWLAMWTVLFALQVIGVAVWVSEHSETITPAPWGSAFLAIITVAGFYTAMSIVCVAKLGQTPGMDVFGVRVVHDDEPPTWSCAAVRSVLPSLAIALPLPYATAVLAALALPAFLGEERATAADRLSRTRVVTTARVTAVHGRRRNHRLIRVGMEKIIAGVTGDASVLRESGDRR
jgi:uncharacterized RDD family membrane protein YckC